MKEKLYDLSKDLILGTEYAIKKSLSLSLYGLDRVFLWGSFWIIFFIPLDDLQDGINIIFNIGRLWVVCWIFLNFLEIKKEDLKELIGKSILAFFLTLFLFFRGPMTFTPNFLIPKITYIREATFLPFKQIQESKK